MRAQLLALLLVVGCSAPATPQLTVAPAPRPTATAPASTATPAPDYTSMRNALRAPLSSLIVAVRGGDSAHAAAFLAEFNAASDRILPLIERDTSPQANALHSVITNVRGQPSNLTLLESERAALLAPP